MAVSASGLGPAAFGKILELALKAAANAIVITDDEGKVIWVNPAFTRLTGYLESEILGRKTSVLKSGVHSQEFYADLWRTISAGGVWRGEMRNRRKDGSLYDEEMTITPFKAHGGRATHYIAVKQDVTEKNRMEKQLLQAQRMDAIGLLAGGVAHDLNNVLAPVLIGIELLRADVTKPASLKLLDSLEASVKRGAGIVRQVLTFARGIEGAFVVFDVNTLVHEFKAIIGETFPKNIRIEYAIPGDLRSVKGDPTQLHQVLLNLCLNARDAMPEGGSLSIAGANVSLDESAARGAQGGAPGKFVALTVADTGVGMPAIVRDHLFEPFFTTKEEGKGAGLGLSTAHGIVRSHGGFIQVDSSPGRGSRFTVYLPATEEQPPGQSPVAEAVPKGADELILVVDDEENIRIFMQKVLEANGYRVETAADGVEGLVQYAKQGDKISLILTDVRMPEMDGVTFCRAVARLNPKAKIIVCTGSGLAGGFDERAELLKKANVHRILMKPYSVAELLGAVHKALHDGPV